MFVIDASGSVETTFRLAMALTRAVAAGLNYNGARTRVSAVTWSDTATLRFPLNQYNTKQATLNALYFPFTRGRTNTAAALDLVRTSALTSNNGDRSGDANFVVCISDGFSNINSGNTPTAATNLQNSATVLAVGAGPRINNAEINAIASNPDTRNAFTMATASQVQSTADAILTRICDTN